MDLAERLTALDYDVCGTAARGEVVAQMVSDHRPDLVLMDINLGGSMDGIETALKLGDECNVPIVFLSAYSDDELIARASRTNA